MNPRKLFITAVLVFCLPPLAPAQPLPQPSGPDLAAAGNPMLISLMVHVEEGRKVSPDRYSRVAAGLRALGRTFRRFNARVNVDIEAAFLRAMFEAGDSSLLVELERDYHFAIGGFPHGRASRETVELIRKSGATPVYIFGNWGRNNTDWIRDAVENDIHVMLGFFSILLPEVQGGTVFDHETIPWNRADRVHPWRVASTETFLDHNPAGEVIYIPGDSIDELEKLHERYLTGLWNRLLDRISPKPSLDEKDFAVASDYLRRQLAFADPERLNTWYIAVNSKKVRDFAASAPLFAQWLSRVDSEFVKPGAARWANAREVADAYRRWEKQQSAAAGR